MPLQYIRYSFRFQSNVRINGQMKVAIIIAQLPYAYKFSRDIYFANVPQLTIFTILISRMAACSCKLVLYAYKFSAFSFCESPLISEIHKNKVRQKFVHITVRFCLYEILCWRVCCPLSVFMFMFVSAFFIS